MTTQLTLFAEDTLASLSVMPGSDEAKRMTVTSGQKCFDLYGSSGPLGLLEKTLLDTSVWGSTMYLLTWKAKATKRGRLYFQLQPSALRTEETGCLSWATPNTMDVLPQRSEEALIRQATTTRKGRKRPANLREQVNPETVKLWPTPQTRDYRSGDNPNSPRQVRKQEQGWSQNLNDAVKVWPTPRANDAEKRGNINTSDPRNGLPAAVKSWPTPAAQDGKNSTLPASQINRDTVPGALMREGQQGQLNPEWVECLMGFPIGWTDINGLQDMDKNNMNGNRQE